MKKLVLILLLLYPPFIYAGGNVKVKKGKKTKGARLPKGERGSYVVLPFASAIWQRAPFGDISIGHPINIHYVKGNFWHTKVAYYKVGAEFDFNFKHELWAPKASSEFDYRYFCLRGNLSDYLSSGKNNLYFTPEFGCTLAGFVSLTGGYNIPLSHSIQAIPRFRISLSILIPVAIIGGAKK